MVQCRLRRIGKSQAAKAHELLTSTFSGHREKSMIGIDLRRDCGCVSCFLRKLLVHYWASSAFIMSQCLSKCYPFAARSLILGSNKFKVDEEDKLEKIRYDKKHSTR